MKKIAWIVLLTFLYAGVVFAGPLERLYGESDADKVIDLDESDVAVIELESNPASGHAWEADETMGQNVRIVGREFEPLYPGLLGSPGVERIFVVGQAKGRSDLVFKYQRAFEKRTLRSLRYKFNALRKYRGSLKLFSQPDAEQTLETTTESDAQAPLGASLLGVPASYNWCSAHGGCPALRDQGQCGGCWSFATQAPLEAWIKATEGREVDLSEQYLLSCNEEGWGCNGGLWAHDYNLKKYIRGENEAGAPLESTMPFKAQNTSCNGPHAKVAKIKSWAYVCGNDRCMPTDAQMKQAIYEHGPLTVAVCVDYAFQNYRGGVFAGPRFGCYQVNHGVVLVGWDDSNSCWIMRNSWGPNWGEKGYMRIRYGASLIGSRASYVVYESSGGGNSGNGGDGGNSDNACQGWTATNTEHVAAARAYRQTSFSGCGFVVTYYAVGSNENLGTMGAATTTLHTEDGGKTYRVGSCTVSGASDSASGCNN